MNKEELERLSGLFQSFCIEDRNLAKRILKQKAEKCKGRIFKPVFQMDNYTYFKVGEGYYRIKTPDNEDRGTN